MCDTDIFKNKIKKNVEEVLMNDMINHIDVIDNITSIKETTCKLNKISNEYKTNLDELKAKIENYNKYKWHNSYFPFFVELVMHCIDFIKKIEYINAQIY